MNIRFLETFVWLCRLQNFNAVAEKLHTTQPSVSQRIATLEDLFRQKLYVRGARQFELTAAGRQLLPYAEQIVELTNDMQRNLVFDDEENSVLRVGIIEFVTLSFLPEFVRLIREQEPNATLNFSTETSPRLVDALVQDELDLAFVWGPMNEPNVHNVRVCSFPLAWLASSTHFDCDTPLDVVDLSQLPIIMNRPGTSGYSLIRDYFTSHGIQNIPASPDPISLNCSYSLATALQLVRTGLGVMAIPPFVMAEEIARKQVCILPVAQSLPTIDLTACARSSAGRRLIPKLVTLAKQAAVQFANDTGDTFCRV